MRTRREKERKERKKRRTKRRKKSKVYCDWICLDVFEPKSHLEERRDPAVEKAATVVIAVAVAVPAVASPMLLFVHS